MAFCLKLKFPRNQLKELKTGLSENKNLPLIVFVVMNAEKIPYENTYIQIKEIFND